MRRLGLRGTMLLVLGLVQLLGLGGLVTLVAIKSRTALTTLSYYSTNYLARSYAGDIEQQLEVAQTIASSLSASLLSLSEASVPRDAATDLVSRFLEKHEGVFSAWAVFAPRAYDGLDARFEPYWNRQNGEPTLGMALDSDASKPEGLFYTVPMSTGKIYFGEPTARTIGGKSTQIISVAAPIESHGKIIGVAGVDLGLDLFQKAVGAIRPFDAGRAFLVSGGGKFLAHFDQAALGKSLEDVFGGSMGATIRKAIAAGSAYSTLMASSTGGEA